MAPSVPSPHLRLREEAAELLHAAADALEVPKTGLISDLVIWFAAQEPRVQLLILAAGGGVPIPAAADVDVHPTLSTVTEAERRAMVERAINARMPEHLMSEPFRNDLLHPIPESEWTPAMRRRQALGDRYAELRRLLTDSENELERKWLKLDLQRVWEELIENAKTGQGLPAGSSSAISRASRR